MKAQLRSKVFEAIERNADQRTKAEAGFKWQNANIEKVHSNADSLLVAHLIRDYFEQYQIEYTKSIFVPEVALDKAADLHQSQRRTDLMGRVPGLDQGNDSESVLVQMLRQLKQQQAQIQQL